MRTITDIATLEALYDSVNPLAVTKVSAVMTPLYRQWIDAARFVVLTTVGPEGTDASPRGDAGPVVRIVDDRTIWLPDWRGNNRLDSLRNIVRDGRVSLMFMVTGENNVVRVNGNAVLCDDPAITAQFIQGGRQPRTVIVIRSGEVYFQCAKALMRSGLWSRDAVQGLPTAGRFLKEAGQGFDADTYDAGYEAYSRDRMW